ncbi:hypothetical protein ACIN8IBEIGE_50042 [Acinetobacter sp. 8I-beige]|nr:hypothetical protein ACIN8IBEIGE_50042 [Acinetobacter sp. 8I-beige]
MCAAYPDGIIVKLNTLGDCYSMYILHVPKVFCTYRSYFIFLIQSLSKSST